MKKRIVITLLLLWHYVADAQVPENRFSLQQCIDYAYTHQSKILNAQLDEQISKARMNELIGVGLPQISASAELTHFIEKPTALVPASNFNGPEDVFLPFQFNLENNSTASVGLSQLIFDGSYIIGVKASRTFVELTRRQTTQSKIDLAVAVSKAYYGVLVTDARMELLNANIDRLTKSVEDLRATYEQGFVEKLDVDRLELTLNNLKTERDRISRLSDLSIYLLKFQMGMEQGEKLILTDKLTDLQPPDLTKMPDTVNYNDRIEYKIISTQKELQNYNIKRYKAQYLPSVFGFANLGTNTSSEEFDLFDSQTKWYWNSVVGAKIQWTLFSGLSRSNRIKMEELSLTKINNGMSTLRQSFQLEYNTARSTYTNAIDAFRTQEKNRELAREIVRVTKIKYDQGVGTNLEVVDAETQLRQSDSNYFTALYEAIVAKIDLEKALGIIR